MDSNLERLRAYVEGTLAADERAAFEADLARDPELAELAEAYGYVVRATADDAPVPATEYDDLPLPRIGWKPVLAIAAILLIAVGATLFFWPKPELGVTLTAISLNPIELPPNPPSMPEGLGDLVTADDDGLVWGDDYDIALRVGKFAGRPVLFFIDYPGCPLCADYEDGPFRDERVVAAARSFVLVRLSWEEASERFQEDPRKGWPIFNLLDHDGRKLDSFKGYKKAPQLARWLRAARADGFAYPEWEKVRDLARLLKKAGTRDHKRLTAVAAADQDGPFGAIANARLMRFAQEAHEALMGAKDADALEAAAAKLDGTPYAADLRRVADFVREHGRMPELR